MTSLVSDSADAPTASDARPLASTPLALALMLMSGFAALGYQIVWTQQSALWLGHEAAAVLAVITAFFGGIALGAFFLGTLIRRSSRPAVWYAVCETLIAAWACVLAIGLHRVANLIQQWIDVQPSPLQHWSVIFSGTFLVLLPATAAMGATLPA
ncbi:MAG: spermidine synthase, partial [Povalibacter sp.]